MIPREHPSAVHPPAPARGAQTLDITAQNPLRLRDTLVVEHSSVPTARKPGCNSWGFQRNGTSPFRR